MTSTQIRKSEDIGISIEELRESNEQRITFLKAYRPELWVDYPPYPEYMDELSQREGRKAIGYGLLDKKTIIERTKLLKPYKDTKPIRWEIEWDYIAECIWDKMSFEHRFKFLTMKFGHQNAICSNPEHQCSPIDWSKLSWSALRNIRITEITWIDSSKCIKHVTEDSITGWSTSCTEYNMEDKQVFFEVEHISTEEVERRSVRKEYNCGIQHDDAHYSQIVPRKYHDLEKAGHTVILFFYDSITRAITWEITAIFKLRKPINRRKMWELPKCMDTKDEPYETWAARWNIEKIEKEYK